MVNMITANIVDCGKYTWMFFGRNRLIRIIIVYLSCDQKILYNANRSSMDENWIRLNLNKKQEKYTGDGE